MNVSITVKVDTVAKQNLKFSPELDIQDPKPELSLIDSAATWEHRASPAKSLQDALAEVYATSEPDAKRWPLRWTVLGLTTTCAAFWAIVFFALFAN
jgi:hypothetical protein